MQDQPAPPERQPAGPPGRRAGKAAALARDAAPRPVWDLFIRVFHWGLVANIIVAAVTGFLLSPFWVPVHILSASAAMVLVVLRIVWGFAGGTYARFSGFVTGPVRLLRYARDVLAGGEAHYIGHNPLGGAMALALMALVLAAGLTGWAFLGASAKLGVLAYVLPYAQAASLLEWHELVGILILLLVALHVAGVVFTGRRESRNLVAAMITGEKDVGTGDLLPPARAPRRRGAAIAGGLAVAALILAGGATALVAPPGAPVARIDPVVAAECSDCHMFYHPILLDAGDWQNITATLEDHFGEDASLDPETTAEISAWLSAHAAGTGDTRVANVFRLDPEAGIRRITDTAFWKERHGWIAPAVFERRDVGSRSNCAACHDDAESGWFSPFSAELPE